MEEKSQESARLERIDGKRRERIEEEEWRGRRVEKKEMMETMRKWRGRWERKGGENT